MELFPSPCGDYGSYHKISGTFVQDLIIRRFRPLAGIMVLISRVDWQSPY